MYYEEKMLNGVLMCRYSPNDEWKQVSNITLVERLTKANSEVEILRAENEQLRSKMKTVKRDDLMNIVKSRIDAEMCDLAEHYGLKHGDVAPLWQMQYDDLMMNVANLLGTWIEDNSEYILEY